ncbi:MAG: hypothetical protein O7G85_04500 [Planctomycetota bacterium]|nr:hypothetical protein [Planctomycetota bacterium]
MAASPSSHSDIINQRPSWFSNPWFKRIGIAMGLALLLGAILVVFSSRDQVAHALAEVKHPSPMHLLVLLGCVLGNIIFSGLLFSLLISRYGKVGLFEMQALIASATLINFLPLRPGLLGRVAYHKTINDIAATDSAKTIIQALLCTMSVAAYFALALMICNMMAWNLWIGLLLPIPIIALLATRRAWRIYALAFGIRHLEVGLWAARYWAAFGLLGLELELQTALALACISVIATMVPFFSNGLGLREWAIGLAAPFLTTTIAHMQIGLTGELVNRAAELLVVTLAGLIGLAYLARRKSRRQSSN